MAKPRVNNEQIEVNLRRGWTEVVGRNALLDLRDERVENLALRKTNCANDLALEAARQEIERLSEKIAALKRELSDEVSAVAKAHDELARLRDALAAKAGDDG